MKKFVLSLIILLSLSAQVLAFEMLGDVRSWKKSDLVGLDGVGDCSAEIGDITSVFARLERDTLFLRVTFDDMALREHNRLSRDTFAGTDIGMHLAVLDQGTGEILLSRWFEIDALSGADSEASFLRTPRNNLLETAIAWQKDSWDADTEKEDLIFETEVFVGNELVDRFSSAGKRGRDEGNCAFVHHGNQGLTYTEVFYGSASGVSGLDGSGFDEILEAHEATEVPGNFHMSGTLMPAAEWHNPEFNDWLTTLAGSGLASMMTSGLGQHMMPFVQDNMNNWSVDIESAMVDYMYGYTPHIAWIPERVWLSPGTYPDSGAIDWLGDNWAQHGVWGIVLDDSPHLDGYDNRKIHWMNNGSSIDLRVIPINNTFVGNMHYDVDAAKAQIASMGANNICVYGTDWEVAAEMNEHDGEFFLDNYEDVLWYCHDNYPGVNVWKLEDALQNPNFNGVTADITPGTYAMLGGFDGYGGSDNSWYTAWAATASHSDYHPTPWTYGTIWDDAYNNLMTSPDNSIAQLGWYTMMINLHETGWHTDGMISDWEHRYSSHIKNANVFAEVSRWAAGLYKATTAAFFSDIDRDGGDELIIHNDVAYFVFEGIGGKANWIFCKDELDTAHSVVGSDVAYWSETDGDYNEGSNNHVAALSDVYPNYQNDIYDIVVDIGSGDTVQATLTKNEVSKTLVLQTGNPYLEVSYDFGIKTGYVKSGWTPGLLDLIWSGKSHLQRMWGDWARYCGQRNSNSGATVALVLGDAGASHNHEFEGTLVKGDEIYGPGAFEIRLFAGYTSEPYDEYFNKVVELDALADEMTDTLSPRVADGAAYLVGPSKLQIIYSEAVDETTAEDVLNYAFTGFTGTYTLASVVLSHNRKVTLTINETFLLADYGDVVVTTVEDLNGNVIDPAYDTATVTATIAPHIVGTVNGWDPANHDYDFVLMDSGVWEVTISLPIGDHDYKVIESDAWEGTDWPGTNQTISLAAPADVTFHANCGLGIGTRDYDEYVTHFNPVIAGDFISELGGTDWDPTDPTGEMAEGKGNGIYELTVLVPAGSWEYKVTLNQNWDQDTQGAADNFYFSSDGLGTTTFTYDMSQNLTTTTGSPECWDDDGDGYDDETCGGDDCNDDNPDVNPAADEVCDDLTDNDCDDLVDTDDPDCGVTKLDFIRHRTNDNQYLNVYEAPTVVGGEINPLLASDLWIGNVGTSNEITHMAACDTDGDGTKEVVFIRHKLNGNQYLNIYDVPATVGGDINPLLASDTWIANVGSDNEITHMIGGDTDGDGTDELIFIRHKVNEDQFLNIYDAPVTVGSDINPLLASDKWIGKIGMSNQITHMAAGDIDGDGTDELIFIRQRLNGNQYLNIYAAPTAVAGDINPLLASDLWIGNIGTSNEITHMAAGDTDDDGTDELVFIRHRSNDNQYLNIYDIPTTVGGDINPLMASDLWIGNIGTSNEITHMAVGR